jgi:hypothetical protein
MAPEPDLSVSQEAESRRQQRAAWAAEVLPALLVSTPESPPQQQVAWEVEVLPALAVVEAESEVVDQAPQASRYSDSLFRQPLLFSFLS